MAEAFRRSRERSPSPRRTPAAPQPVNAQPHSHGSFHSFTKFKLPFMVSPGGSGAPHRAATDGRGPWEAGAASSASRGRQEGRVEPGAVQLPHAPTMHVSKSAIVVVAQKLALNAWVPRVQQQGDGGVVTERPQTAEVWWNNREGRLYVLSSKDEQGRYGHRPHRRSHGHKHGHKHERNARHGTHHEHGRRDSRGHSRSRSRSRGHGHRRHHFHHPDLTSGDHRRDRGHHPHHHSRRHHSHPHKDAVCAPGQRDDHEHDDHEHDDDSDDGQDNWWSSDDHGHTDSDGSNPSGSVCLSDDDDDDDDDDGTAVGVRSFPHHPWNSLKVACGCQRSPRGYVPQGRKQGMAAHIRRVLCCCCRRHRTTPQCGHLDGSFFIEASAITAVDVQVLGLTAASQHSAHRARLIVETHAAKEFKWPMTTSGHQFAVFVPRVRVMVLECSVTDASALVAIAEGILCRETNHSALAQWLPSVGPLKRYSTPSTHHTQAFLPRWTAPVVTNPKLHFIVDAVYSPVSRAVVERLVNVLTGLAILWALYRLYLSFPLLTTWVDLYLKKVLHALEFITTKLTPLFDKYTELYMKYLQPLSVLLRNAVRPVMSVLSPVLAVGATLSRLVLGRLLPVFGRLWAAAVRLGTCVQRCPMRSRGCRALCRVFNVLRPLGHIRFDPKTEPVNRAAQLLRTTCKKSVGLVVACLRKKPLQQPPAVVTINPAPPSYYPEHNFLVVSPFPSAELTPVPESPELFTRSPGPSPGRDQVYGRQRSGTSWGRGPDLRARRRQRGAAARD